MTIRSTLPAKSSGGTHSSFAPDHSGFLQRKCACGGAAGASGECEQCQKKREGSLQRQTLDRVGSGAGFNRTFNEVNAASPRSIAINRPGDVFEQEADRAADAVASDRRAPVLQSAPASSLQRDDAQTGPPPPKKEPSNEEKYQAALKKFGEAFLETSAGKELKGKAEELGKDFVSSVEGKVIAGTALGGALAALIAANKELPVPIPEIPLDFIAPGLKAKLVWEGPVRNPTTASLTLTTKSGVSVGASYSKTEGSPGKPADERAGLTLTIPLGGSPAKPKSDADKNEKYRAETARLAADQDKFREGMKPTAQKAAENKEYWEMFWRMKAGEKKKDDLMLMREATHDSAGAGSAPPIVHDVLSESGQALDAATRGFMESRFGHDFSGVRVHTDGKAAESAHAVHARAYTVGNHVAFAAGHYAPGTWVGRRLLAHELTHTIQQRGSLGFSPEIKSDKSFESNAEAAGRTVANGQTVTGGFPSCGIGLARSPVPPDAWDDQTLAKELQEVNERLKQASYSGRDRDVDWAMRLRFIVQNRSQAKQPAPVAPPKPPAAPQPPRPDPVAERAKAVAEAEAVAAQMGQDSKDDDAEEPEPTPMAIEGKSPAKPKAKPARRKASAPKAAPSKFSPGGFTDDDIYGDLKASTKRIDEQIDKDREISRKPYKDRLQEVRIKLQKKSDNWYSRNEAFSKMTGDEVWAEGMNDGLFIESEKKSVYEDQNSLQQYINEEMQKDRERARAKFESDQYQALVAKGEQLRSPQTIIQPFVVAAAAPELVVAAYFGTQSGAMVGETYNACRHGTKADCASASAQLALMYGMYRLSRTKPGEAAPENPNLTFPRGTDVTNRSVFPPEVPAPTPSVSPKPNQIPAARAWDLHGKPLADPAFAKPGVPGGPDRVFVIPEPNGTAKVYVVRNGREEFFSSTDRTLAEQEKRGFITSKPEGNKLSVDELRGKRVLDLAAGTEGRTVRELRQLKIDVEGMDIALEESAKNTGFLHRGDIITGVPAKGQFDIAYEFYGGLAYGLGKDTKAAFQNAISRLRPGGTLYIAPLSENARKALKPFVDDLVKQGGQLKPTKIDPPGDEVWRIITPKGGA